MEAPDWGHKGNKTKCPDHAMIGLNCKKENQNIKEINAAIIENEILYVIQIEKNT